MWRQRTRQKASVALVAEFTGGLIPSHGTTVATHTYTVTLPIANGSWWIKLVQQDLDGTRTAYDAQLIQMDAPVKFALGQNYPKPFNPSAQILFSIAKEGQVEPPVWNKADDLRTVNPAPIRRVFHIRARSDET